VKRFKIGKQLGDVSEETLRFYRQIGVEEVTMPSNYVTTVTASRPMVPPVQRGPARPQPPAWTVEELARIRERIETFDLVPTAISLPISANVIHGQPERDADLERICRSLEAAGQVGLSVATYTFQALRASEGYYLRLGEGRGGSDLRAFDAARIDGLPPLDSVARISRAEIWENLSYFLKTVIPVAEGARLRLAGHFNDPPVTEFRGVGQALRSLADLTHLIEVVDSPANSVFLDTGGLTEMGESAPEAIRFFGKRDRIGTVHFRNVHVELPYLRYTETFLDDGDCDVLASAQALADVGYNGLVDPDHTPGFSGDTTDHWIGWAFAIGQLIALRTAVYPRLTNGTS